MTMKGYPRIIRDKGEMWMPKETFQFIERKETENR